MYFLSYYNDIFKCCGVIFFIRNSYVLFWEGREGCLGLRVGRVFGGRRVIVNVFLD